MVEANPWRLTKGDVSEGKSPADWIGEKVMARMDSEEEVTDTLEGVTDHGFIIDVSNRRGKGPSYYSWHRTSWMYPTEQRRTG